MSDAAWFDYLAAIDAWRARPGLQTAADALTRYRDLCRALNVPSDAIVTLTMQHAIARTLTNAA